MNGTMWMWLAWGWMAMGVGGYGWVWERSGKKGRWWMEWGLVVLVAGVSMASMLTHEPFTDEVHAWLQAKEMTVRQLWKEMAFEGHLLTWHLLLHQFAKWGSPVVTLGWIAWGINAATVAWFARKAPFGGWAKAAACLSCVFLYVNPSISRCYVLVPPVLFAMAALWGKRNEHPLAFGALVALLANTHVCMEGTAAALFWVFAWEIVLRRKEGNRWLQWAGLGVMVAGGMLALAQVLPSLWKSEMSPGRTFGWAYNTALLFAPCNSRTGIVLTLAGVVLLGAEAWRRDRGVFWILAGSLGYMWGFAVFVYPPTVLNRAALWWPVVLSAAWMLKGRDRRNESDNAELSPIGTSHDQARCPGDAGKRPGMGCGEVGVAVALIGLALMRPEMTWRDWRREYDPLRGACRWISERYGKDAEVWINGGDVCAEAAAAYLDNLMDWTTGEKAKLHCYSAARPRVLVVFARPFSVCTESLLRSRPEQENLIVLASLEWWSGLRQEDLSRDGVSVVYARPEVLDPNVTRGVLVLDVKRGLGPDRGVFWLLKGVRQFERGDRNGAMEAWERATREDSAQWGAMNNLAWLCAEEGHIAEARAWMDCTMANEAAWSNAGVWDTEAAVRRAEGDEEGAREAERRRDKLREGAGTNEK